MQKISRLFFPVVFLFSSHSIAALKPVLTLSAGVDNANLGITNTYVSFISPFSNAYVDTNSTDTRMLAGVFLGAQFNLNPMWDWQLGLSYYQNSGFQTTGIVYQFGNPAMGNFDYAYQITSRRLLAETKLLCTIKTFFHPYVDVAIGDAFNEAHDYSESPLTNDTVTATQLFGSNTTSNFTYLAGVGLDMDITKKCRFGVGYRYVDFGSASLGTSPLQVDSNTLKNNDITSNEYLFQITEVL